MKKLLCVMVILTVLFSCTAAMAADASDEDLTDGEKILEEASQGVYEPLTLEEATQKSLDTAFRIIKLLNALALPILVLMFSIGALFFCIGRFSSQKGMRAWGLGTIFTSIFVFVLIRLAPVILATVDGMVRNP